MGATSTAIAADVTHLYRGLLFVMPAASTRHGDVLAGVLALSGKETTWRDLPALAGS